VTYITACFKVLFCHPLFTVVFRDAVDSLEQLSDDEEAEVEDNSEEGKWHNG